MTEPSAGTCEWFRWLGGAACDRCGRSPQEHLGLEWSDPSIDFSPFEEVKMLHVEWKDYGPGRVLDVPLFTQCFVTPGNPQEVEVSGKAGEGQ